MNINKKLQEIFFDARFPILIFTIIGIRLFQIISTIYIMQLVNLM